MARRRLRYRLRMARARCSGGRMRYGLPVRGRSKLPYPPLVLAGGPNTVQKPHGSDTRSYLAGYGLYTARWVATMYGERGGIRQPADSSAVLLKLQRR